MPYESRNVSVARWFAICDSCECSPEVAAQSQNIGLPFELITPPAGWQVVGNSDTPPEERKLYCPDCQQRAWQFLSENPGT